MSVAVRLAPDPPWHRTLLVNNGISLPVAMPDRLPMRSGTERPSSLDEPGSSGSSDVGHA